MSLIPRHDDSPWAVHIAVVLAAIRATRTDANAFWFGLRLFPGSDVLEQTCLPKVREPGNEVLPSVNPHAVQKTIVDLNRVWVTLGLVSQPTGVPGKVCRVDDKGWSIPPISQHDLVFPNTLTPGDERLVRDQVLDEVIPGDRMVAADLAGSILDAENGHAHHVIAVADELTQRLLDRLTVLWAHVTHDDLTTQPPSAPPNDEAHLPHRRGELEP
jgi:hypothetical protein